MECFVVVLLNCLICLVTFLIGAFIAYLVSNYRIRRMIEKEKKIETKIAEEALCEYVGDLDNKACDDLGIKKKKQTKIYS